MLQDVLQVGLVLMLTYSFQTAVGFAGGLLSMPVLVTLGYSVPMAVEMNVTAALLQSLVSAYSLREDIPWRLVSLPAFLRVAGLFLGIAFLYQVQDLDREVLKQGVGFAVLGLTLLQMSLHPLPRENVSLHWTVLAGLCSGFGLGAVGMGGPFLVLWVMAHNWSSLKTRGTLFAAYIPGTIVGVIMGPLVFGQEVFYGLCVALLASPIILAGIPLGMWIGKLIPKPMLKKIAYLTLLFVSAKAIFGF
jgi:hypothetical protein